ncbi:alkaline phosphatase D family protein [Yinghuangia sp. ASG 101]|uniref:alkaline phosphatase D family protein n=1 Tax=Yinghuangia sp. ASG 101 TaxID=2896848 RepID=UPI001E52626B|nr:alkaline phosphatase D family protein [Yinghuangia sp. ASG 101]UGQ12955.1 alkaline phosphatase D family protein [Yinghuangia sp. ASG 101]
MTSLGKEFGRRNFLRAGTAAGAGLALTPVVGAASAAAAETGGAPAYVVSGRPELSHGVQSGDATADSAIVWGRADRPGRLVVEYGTRPDLRDAKRVRGPLLTPDTDLTGRVRLRGLPAGHRVHYRVSVEGERGAAGRALTGSLVTAPHEHARADVRLVWSGDTVGQGYGINPDLGGMTIFEEIRKLRPDVFLNSGDTVYSDGPLEPAVTLPDGRVWHNLTTPEKSKVAETLAEYRGQFAYNLLDHNYRAFAAEIAQINQWDDHEVTNNWYPGEILDDARYTEKNVDVLAARAAQAFREWQPLGDDRIYRKLSYGRHLDVFVLDMRTHKDRNDENRYADPKRGLLGTRQRRWLIEALSRSRATWKVIAADLPLGLIVPDGATAQEGVAQGDNGAPLGRELEFAEVLSTARRRGVHGIVFLTADVHYTAAHHYDPSRAAFQDFDPFWEFVSGPLNAGAFGPNTLDGTFGPRAEFVHAPPRANTSPMEGFQHFGEVAIDGPSGELTVRLRDAASAVLWSTTLRPVR